MKSTIRPAQPRHSRHGSVARVYAIMGLAGFAACELDPGSANGETSAARQAWATTTATCGRYHYMIVDESFSGFRSTTTIEVSGDQPITRRYAESMLSAAGDRVPAAMWTETGTEIGGHAEGRAAKASPAIDTNFFPDTMRTLARRHGAEPHVPSMTVGEVRDLEAVEVLRSDLWQTAV